MGATYRNPPFVFLTWHTSNSSLGLVDLPFCLSPHHFESPKVFWPNYSLFILVNYVTFSKTLKSEWSITLVLPKSFLLLSKVTSLSLEFWQPSPLVLWFVSRTLLFSFGFNRICFYVRHNKGRMRCFLSVFLTPLWRAPKIFDKWD